MEFLVAFQSLCIVAIVGGFLVYLKRRDDRERDERRALLNRIEAPGMALEAPVEFETPEIVSDEERELEALREAEVGATH